jgi:hypothetical protein
MTPTRGRSARCGPSGHLTTGAYWWDMHAAQTMVAMQSLQANLVARFDAR